MKSITISVSKPDILADVEALTSYAAALDAAAIRAEAPSDPGREAAGAAAFERLAAAPEQLADLDQLYQEAFSQTTAALRHAGESVTPKASGWTLSVASRFPSQLTAKAADCVSRSIARSIAAQWFSLAGAQQRAADSAALAASLLKTALHLLYHRERPSRPSGGVGSIPDPSEPVQPQ